MQIHEFKTFDDLLQGKFIRVQFSSVGKIAGADIESCLSDCIVVSLLLDEWFSSSLLFNNHRVRFAGKVACAPPAVWRALLSRLLPASRRQQRCPEEYVDAIPVMMIFIFI
jgi:hypothetical protein